MKRRFLSIVELAALVALRASAAMAHGDKKHVIGTLEVKLVATTMYVSRDGKASKLSDLAVGDRVVVHATPNGETLSADEIKFSLPGAASSGGPSAAKPQP